MLAKRPLGQGAASKKYDVLTALGAHGCAGTKFDQRRILRFVTLVTARYNWQRDELTIGRPELARLWQVDERTVKRELAVLKEKGWLHVKRPPARGRVTAYAIDWEAVLRATRPAWAHVGPDYAERMIAMVDPAGAGQGDSSPDTTVVPFPSAVGSETEWGRASAALHRADPGFFANWLARVVRLGVEGGVLRLSAPSAFHADYLNTHARARLTRLVQAEDPAIHRVEIEH